MVANKWDVMKSVPWCWKRKCWDILRDVIICVTNEGWWKSGGVLRSAPSGWQIEGNEKDGISQAVSQFVCLWSTSKKAGMSQEVSLVVGRSMTTKKMGYPKECHELWPQWGASKSKAAPRKNGADLLSDVIKSVTGFGQKSGNRHFAKRISPTRIYRWLI